jgi:hypothetical protein
MRCARQGIGAAAFPVCSLREGRQTQEDKLVLNRQKYMLAAALIVVLACVMVGTAVAQKTAVPKAPNTIALGEDEVKQLLLLMDTDKNGKISKKEFMDFMSVEFDRLDTDKSGELDPKELVQSQIRPSRSALGK